MGNVETVLASSIVAVAWAAGVVSGTMWFGSVTTPVQCFGPTRYAWDLGLYLSASESLVQRSCSSRPAECLDGWREVPSGLVFYDYLGRQGREPSIGLALPKSGRCRFVTDRWPACALVWNVGPGEFESVPRVTAIRWVLETGR